MANNECRKNQQRKQPAPWTGRTIIEGKPDEFEGQVMHLTQSEEMLIHKSCDESWRGAECRLVQPRISALKTDPRGRKHRTFQEEESFDFRKSPAREQRRSSSDSVTVHPPDVVVGPVFLSRVSRRPQHVQTTSQSCVLSFELLRQDKLVFLGAPWPVWSPNFAGVKDVQIVGKLGVMKSRISVNESEVMGETALRKQGFVFVLPSVVEQNVKRKREMDRAELPKTASMKQHTDLMRGSNNKMRVT